MKWGTANVGNGSDVEEPAEPRPRGSQVMVRNLVPGSLSPNRRRFLSPRRASPNPILEYRYCKCPFLAAELTNPKNLKRI